MAVLPLTAFPLTALPFAPLPLGMPPGPLALEVGPVRWPPWALVLDLGRHMDRAGLNVHGFLPNEDRRLDEERQSGQADRDLHIGARLRGRCGAECGGCQDGGSDESRREGALHDECSWSCDEVILRAHP